MRVQSQLQLQQKPVRVGWCGCCCCCCVWARPTSQPAKQASQASRGRGRGGEGARPVLLLVRCACDVARSPTRGLCAGGREMGQGKGQRRLSVSQIRQGPRGPGAGAGAAAAASFVLRRQRKASQAGKQRGAPALTRTDSCPPQPLKIQMNPTCDLPYSTVRSKMTSQRSLFRNRAAKRRVSRFGF